MFKNIEIYIFNKLYNELWYKFSNSEFNQLLLDDIGIMETLLRQSNKIKLGIVIELNTNIIYDKLSDEEINKMKMEMKRDKSYRSCVSSKPRRSARDSARPSNANSTVHCLNSARPSNVLSARPSDANSQYSEGLSIHNEVNKSTRPSYASTPIMLNKRENNVEEKKTEENENKEEKNDKSNNHIMVNKINKHVNPSVTIKMNENVTL